MNTELNRRCNHFSCIHHSVCRSFIYSLFVLSRLLASLWVSRTGSASDWCALQEALYKCINSKYNTILATCFVYDSGFVCLVSACISLCASGDVYLSVSCGL